MLFFVFQRYFDTFLTNIIHLFCNLKVLNIKQFYFFLQFTYYNSSFFHPPPIVIPFVNQLIQTLIYMLFGQPLPMTVMAFLTRFEIKKVVTKKCSQTERTTHEYFMFQIVLILWYKSQQSHNFSMHLYVFCQRLDKLWGYSSSFSLI